jgi:predicted secreted protein
MKLLSALIGLLLLAALPARAGDTAELAILGFSADGGVFAFEEYGMQDGSGFVYANRYYIDTATDKFLPGTPVRVTLEEDGATVNHARAQASAQGEAIVPASVLAANPGFTAGLNPVTEFGADPFRMAVNPRPVFPAIDPPLEVRLEQFPILPGPDICQNLGVPLGFSLVRLDTADGGVTKLLHKESSIPASRGCPIGYRIAGIQTFSADALTAFAVLIAVEKVGFEGPDHRYIAVTSRF